MSLFGIVFGVAVASTECMFSCVLDDHSRVILDGSDISDSDYINANYIDVNIIYATIKFAQIQHLYA